MKLVEIIWQSRNDYDGIFCCEHCGSFQRCSDCYHDERFSELVIPAIKCLDCGKRSVETIPDGITDPGTQFGVKAKKVKVMVEKWSAI
jgi:hypothetical protein